MRGVEHFLAAAAEQFRQAAGEQRHHAGAEHAGRDAAGNPQPAARHAGGHRHDDADDQAGLEDLAEDDQQRASTDTSCVIGFTARNSWHDQKTLRLMVEIVEEIVAARLLRPHMDDGLAARRHDLFEMQIAAFELGRRWR